jgi:hypothetical protein
LKINASGGECPAGRFRASGDTIPAKDGMLAKARRFGHSHVIIAKILERGSRWHSEKLSEFFPSQASHSPLRRPLGPIWPAILP